MHGSGKFVIGIWAECGKTQVAELHGWVDVVIPSTLFFSFPSLDGDDADTGAREFDFMCFSGVGAFDAEFDFSAFFAGDAFDGLFKVDADGSLAVNRNDPIARLEPRTVGGGIFERGNHGKLVVDEGDLDTDA